MPKFRGLSQPAQGFLRLLGAGPAFVAASRQMHHGFRVAGFSGAWEWSQWASGGDVKTSIGSCDINFLTGKGFAAQGLGAGKPVKVKIRRLKLADWSDEMRPKVCEF